MATALFTHPDCFEHHTPPGHAEQVARLDAVLAALEDLPLQRHNCPLAAEDDLLRVHPKSYLESLKARSPESGTVALDADTFLSPGSLAAAYRAAGGAVAAVDAVLSGAANNAFVAMRPPGHHAERETAMGFCLFGNVAIAAKHALDHHGLKRVAIVDFDVHHGNGTQNLVEDDPRILFISSHQMPLYPGTGDPADRGPHGTVTNIAFSDGTGSETFRNTYTNDVFPKLRAFAPELLIISAGFDAHAADPLAGMRLQTEDFGWVTTQLTEIAAETCAGRVVSCLEGGYDLEALGESVKVHVGALEEAGR